ncbi:MAG: hypothetical protein IJP33_02360 [Firmicutes bacterium]|nr:hypothetical protein [Bacillota bacterium]
MFPITHFYINQQFYTPTPLLAIGGIFPDIAAACGMERNEAHLIGKKLYDFCVEKYPEAIDLGRGVFLHGATEGGADYYSDEFWEGGEKGWCFQKGAEFAEEVGKATKLDEEYWLWKSHNFIELGLEIITDIRNPYLKTELCKLLEDKKAQELAAKVLKDFANVNSKKLIRTLNDIDSIFELKNVNFITLAQNQYRGIIRRFNSDQSDITQMAITLKHITDNMLENYEYDQFMSEVTEKMSKFLLY